MPIVSVNAAFHHEPPVTRESSKQNNLYLHWLICIDYCIHRVSIIISIIIFFRAVLFTWKSVISYSIGFTWPLKVWNTKLPFFIKELLKPNKLLIFVTDGQDFRLETYYERSRPDLNLYSWTNITKIIKSCIHSTLTRLTCSYSLVL